MMLKTKLGEINIIVNNEKIDFEISELNKKESNFVVDGRYKILIHAPKSPFIVDCFLDNVHDLNIESFPETGEDLAMISFYNKSNKLSIGTVGDIAGMEYEYLKDRIRVKYSGGVEIKQIIFYVAWLTIQDSEKEDIYTWFAADPTL